MFYRNVITELRKWVSTSDRKPLILRGARQVGKTTAVVHRSRIKTLNKKFLEVQKPFYKKVSGRTVMEAKKRDQRYMSHE